MIKTPLSTVIGGAFWTPEATVINGAKLSFEIVMKKLFANNEQGFAYDPNDLSSMFQDAAGTAPATGVGQTVGLVLDKSKGLALGAELFNKTIDFSTWTKTAAVTSAVGNTFTVNAFGGCFLNPFFAGYSPLKTYLVRVVGSCTVATEVTRSSGNLAPVSIAAGDFDITIRSSQTFKDGTIYFRATAAGSVTVTSISAKELAGNHAYQSTSAARPILQDAPRRIDFDTVDNKLITNLPAQLTGCTVIRSVPNVGTQILTGQTIPATYNDNTDHCGLIVINRALTATETSQITAIFNKAAGV